MPSVSRPIPPALLLAPNPVLPGWKRALDLVCCAVALPALFFVAALYAVLLALASPGPIFFRQQRVGYMGRKFMLYKFRTMRLDAAIDYHRAHFRALLVGGLPMQKLDGVGDARLIPGAWLLRASGLDELPQIINVLRGEMSLVGPRPCIPYEYEQYTPGQRARFGCVPGLTGLWQVSGKNRTTFDEMVRLDVEYGRRQSLWLDLTIVIRTVPALCRQIADIYAARHQHPRRTTTAAASTYQA